MMYIKNETKVKVIQYRPELSALCSIEKMPFYAAFEIEYYPEDKLLEFVAFEAWLNTLRSQEFTVESLCDCVFEKITNELGFVPLSVLVNSRTLSHYPATAIRVRTVEDIRRNPVIRSMKDRKILVPSSMPPIPSKVSHTTKRGKR